MQRSNNARAIWAKICFFSSLAHEDSVSCSHSGDGGAVASAAHFSLCVSFVHVFLLFTATVFSLPLSFFRAAVADRQLH